MKNETKRTPGEWHAGHIGEGEYRCDVVFDADSGQVCEIIGRGEQAEADAAYIARCCNSHDALVEALRSAMKQCGELRLRWLRGELDAEGVVLGVDVIDDMARAALALATVDAGTGEKG